MKKRSWLIVATILIMSLVLLGCRTTWQPGPWPEPEEEVPPITVTAEYVTPASSGNVFFLNMNNLEESSFGGWSPTDPQPRVADTVIDANRLTFSFTKNNTRAIFILSEEQIAAINNATAVNVTISGSANTDMLFRYHIGNAFIGADWNATNGIGPAVFPEILTGRLVIDKSRPDMVTHFMLQVRHADMSTHTPIRPTTVVIESIRFELIR